MSCPATTYYVVTWWPLLQRTLTYLSPPSFLARAPYRAVVRHRCHTVSSTLRLCPEPLDPFNLSYSTKWSLRCRALASTAVFPPDFQTAAATAARLHRTHSPETSPIPNLPPIGSWCSQLKPGVICLPAPGPHRRRRAPLRRWGLVCEGFWSEDISVKVQTFLGFSLQIGSSLLVCFACNL
jgi:hypothetical protein